MNFLVVFARDARAHSPARARGSRWRAPPPAPARPGARAGGRARRLRSLPSHAVPRALPGGPGWLRGGRGGVRGIAPARRGGDAPSHPPSAHIPTPRVARRAPPSCPCPRPPRPPPARPTVRPHDGPTPAARRRAAADASLRPLVHRVPLVSALRGARFIIDWHNFAYTLMALQLGERHPLVAIARRYEAFAGRFAHRAIRVTERDARWLAGGVGHTRRGDPAATAHPRSSPASLEDAHELFARRDPRSTRARDGRPDDPGSLSAARAIAERRGTPARRRRDHTVHRASNDRAARVEGILRDARSRPRWRRAASDGRPALLVSSTSWTPSRSPAACSTR